MIKTFKTISLLLSYPDQELQEFLTEVIPVLNDESLLEKQHLDGTAEFVKYYSKLPLMEWQEQYVQLFDFTRSVSLHLFEHVHGDSKDRGQAMIDLAEEYLKAGLKLESGELPDYLPVFLEYLALLDKDEATGLVTETVHILGAIRYRLEEKSNPYAHLFSALISLSDEPVEKDIMEKVITNQKPVDFDREYKDEAVRFGGNENPCDRCK